MLPSSVQNVSSGMPGRYRASVAVAPKRPAPTTPEGEPIEVVHVNASNDRGGAARSCVCLHLALEAVGAHSRLVLEPPYVPDGDKVKAGD